MGATEPCGARLPAISGVVVDQHGGCIVGIHQGIEASPALTKHCISYGIPTSCDLVWVRVLNPGLNTTGQQMELFGTPKNADLLQPIGPVDIFLV